MSTVEIPLSSDAEHFDLQVTLDGVALLMTFRWNARNEAWYLDLATQDGTAIVSGRKVVVEWPLMLRQFRDSDHRLPGGHLWAADTTGANTRPGRSDLGMRVRLYYREEADLS